MPADLSDNLPRSDTGGATGPTSETREIAALVHGYYQALERGEPLEGFYAVDKEAGALGPPVKIGSGHGEVFTGHAAIAAEVRRVVATLTRNELESRSLIVRRCGDLGWFVDQVWWRGEAAGGPFASLTRWTGLCLRFTGGWKLLQLHVSEET